MSATAIKTDFNKRLNQILPRLTSPELLTNTGLGNEIGFYIFDYPAESELLVREHVAHIMSQLAKKHPAKEKSADHKAHGCAYQKAPFYYQRRSLANDCRWQQ